MQTKNDKQQGYTEAGGGAGLLTEEILMMGEGFKATGMLLVPPQTTATSTATTSHPSNLTAPEIVREPSRREAEMLTIPQGRKKLR